jgi:hypothetical protein
LSSIPLRLFALAMGVMLVPTPVVGQIQAEIRGGITVGSHTGTAAGLDFAPALSFEALVVHQITPLISAYGGYARTSFGCKEGFCLDRDLNVTGNHVVVGAEARKRWAWLRLGVLLGKTEVGSEGESPDLGPGLDAGAGVALGSGRLSFLPGISYRWMAANTPSNSDHAVAVGLGLGVRVRFGSHR